MYCILVSGMPASGKSTIARQLSALMALPLLSKDSIKEILFDELGFSSREEKVRLGVAAMRTMYYAAGQLMRAGTPFILENNFEGIRRGHRSPAEGTRLLRRHAAADGGSVGHLPALRRAGSLREPPSGACGQRPLS